MEASYWRADVISSRSFIRLAMFKLELEWTVGVGGAGEGRKEKNGTINHFPYDLRVQTINPSCKTTTPRHPADLF